MTDSSCDRTSVILHAIALTTVLALVAGNFSNKLSFLKSVALPGNPAPTASVTPR